MSLNIEKLKGLKINESDRDAFNKAPAKLLVEKYGFTAQEAKEVQDELILASVSAAGASNAPDFTFFELALPGFSNLTNALNR